MNIENQVCTLEQAKRLKELGIETEAAFYHIDNSIIGYEGIKLRVLLNQSKKTGIPIDSGAIKYFPAFTVAELGEMLPERYNTFRDSISTGHGKTIYWAGFDDEDEQFPWQETGPDYKTEAECRAAMLIKLLEDKAKPSHTTSDQ
jgi:hypothetical protein